MAFMLRICTQIGPPGVQVLDQGPIVPMHVAPFSVGMYHVWRNTLPMFVGRVYEYMGLEGAPKVMKQPLKPGGT